MKRKTHPILDFLKRVLHLKRSLVYHDEMILIGLVSAMGLHAIYDFVLTMNFHVLGFPLHVPVMLFYFFGGFWILMRLLKKKDLNLKLGLVGTEIMPKKDFIKLLDEVQEIKEKMQSDIQNYSINETTNYEQKEESIQRPSD